MTLLTFFGGENLEIPHDKKKTVDDAKLTYLRATETEKNAIETGSKNKEV